MFESLAGELAAAVAALVGLADFVVLEHQLVAAHSAVAVQPVQPVAEPAAAVAGQHWPELAVQLAEPAVLVELPAVVGSVVP